MSNSYKIIGRNTKTKRQVDGKKRIYTSKEDYLKYKDDIIKRYRNFWGVEVHELVKGKWKLIKYYKIRFFYFKK